MRSILWILTTQWRGQALGYAGDPNARTPALDALAAQSVRFDAAITPHPFGPFARAAILTGVPCPANGVSDYFDPLPREARTVAHRMNERGYATAFFGKWHLAPRDRSAPPVGEVHARTRVAPEDRGGFQFWEGFEGGFLLNDPWLHGSRLPAPVRFPGYQSDVLAQRAGEWIAEAPAGPWFCLLSLEPPHPPYGAPASGIQAPDAAGLRLAANVPRGGAVEARARAELSGYYAHLAATDRALGRLLARVPAEATVVFTSVHGDMHGAHGLFRKGWPHEESIRVPLLIRSPGHAPRTVTAPVSLLHLEALTLDPLEAPRPPVLSSMPSVAPFAHQCDRPWVAERTETSKIVREPGRSTPWLRFDLAADPLEMRPLP
ncbi:MAG TPA: sulfatase-like hydrolase/transferase [Opitutaceae bacterium]|nr:sulfatase-like hydrolase/transferase [Opitutaceae bacterium]